eukprot:TRINITY_DN9555_c0_g1_i1.p1 TRINITY_DN9555_c0_g1~~TRINITY_DN9555_c0_g1_i1.p1  ORF type:complete len:375 (+),score=72.05 TRINITY_DN9555_c0_g1_i1:544-1668(+)
MKLKESLYIMYLELMGDFMRFFRADAQQPFVANNVFNTKEYLESIDEERKEFMKEFVNTQNFSGFIETAYKARSEVNEVSYFIEGAKILQNSGKPSLILHCNQLLDRALTSYNNPAIYSLEECYRIYKSLIKTDVGDLERLGYGIDPCLVVRMPGINVVRHYRIRIKKDAGNASFSNVKVRRKLPRVRLRKNVNKAADSEQIEDCSIAEEFETNEEPIHKELERRELENVYKAPGLGNSFISAHANPLLRSSELTRHNESCFLPANKSPMEVADMNKEATERYNELVKAVQVGKLLRLNVGKALNRSVDQGVTLESVSAKSIVTKRLCRINSSNIIMKSNGEKVPAITKIVKQKARIHRIRATCRTPQYNQCLE